MNSVPSGWSGQLVCLGEGHSFLFGESLQSVTSVPILSKGVASTVTTSNLYPMGQVSLHFAEKLDTVVERRDLNAGSSAAQTEAPDPGLLPALGFGVRSRSPRLSSPGLCGARPLS